MQAFKANFYLIGLIVLLTACTEQETSPLPTPIMVDEGMAAVATPTLLAQKTAVSTINTEPTASLGDPYIPYLGNTGYDVQHYLLRFDLNPTEVYVHGETLIEAQATAENLQFITLDFIGFEIESVRVNGMNADFSRAEGKLRVDLPQPLAAGTLFELAVVYAGQPVREPSAFVGFVDALGWQFTDEGTIYAVSEPDGARYWFPANDHPRDKALFRFEVTVPAGLTAVANGRLLTQQINSSTSTFIWEHAYPMATYLAVVAVGPYERIDAVSPGGVRLRHYALPESREEFETAVAITGEAIDWMSQLFGAYPFEEFGYVMADMPGASMETQTMVLISSQMMGQRTAVHEMAHMWFGNWVSLDSWQEMWRKEGFATYVALMWEYRGDPEGLDLAIAGVEAAVAENDPQYPLGNPPPAYLLGYNTYFQGAALIHALRQEVGDTAFFAGLRIYFQQYGGKAASDAEFQTIMEESANRELDAFFDEWLK